MSKEDESKIEIPDTQVAIAIAGSVDSGKSSYIGVTTSGVLDNGRGSARAGVAKHPHEVESGQTSDISTRILNIKDKNKAITFVDLCGHEKYLKTTVRGIASYFPDYGCVIVSPQREVTDMTTQHYKMLISHNIPIFIVVTRVDVSLEEQYNRTLKSIERMCKKSGSQKVDIINTYYTYHKQKSGEIDDEAFKKEKETAINKVIENMDVNKNGKQTLVPVITISNVDGYYIDVCKEVMGSLEPREIWNQTSTNNRVVKMFQKKLNLKDDDIKSDFDVSLF
jgi:elongation factor 1-alpha